VRKHRKEEKEMPTSGKKKRSERHWDEEWGKRKG